MRTILEELLNFWVILIPTYMIRKSVYKVETITLISKSGNELKFNNIEKYCFKFL